MTLTLQENSVHEASKHSLLHNIRSPENEYERQEMAADIFLVIANKHTILKFIFSRRLHKFQ